MCARLIRSRRTAAASASSARVLTPASNDSSASVDRDVLAGLDEEPDRVGEVELALGVVRLDPFERPARACRSGRRRSPSSSRGSRARRRWRRGPRRCARAGRRRRGRGGRSGGRRRYSIPSTVAAAPVVRCVSTSSRSISEVSSTASPESTSTFSARPSRARACGSERVAGAERLLLDRDLDAARSRPRVCGEATTTIGSAPALRGREDHPVDHPAAEKRVEVLRDGRAHAGAEPGGEDDGCDRRIAHVSKVLMAGAPGFEPGIAGPKPAALPLGYAPLRAEYRCGRRS